MIAKGMKVGDTFEDGGLTYRVTKVVGENYESIWVGATSPKAPVADNVKEEKKVVEDDYEEMAYAQLKKVCAEKGLDATGKKEDLIARLKG